MAKIVILFALTQLLFYSCKSNTESLEKEIVDYYAFQGKNFDEFKKQFGEGEEITSGLKLYEDGTGRLSVSYNKDKIIISILFEFE